MLAIQHTADGKGLLRGHGHCPHAGGEGDLRACFIAMAIAHMLHLDKEELARRAGMVGYVKACQVGYV